MMLMLWELLQPRHLFLARSGLVCMVIPGLLSPIRSLWYHLQGAVTTNGHLSLRSGPIRFLVLLRWWPKLNSFLSVVLTVPWTRLPSRLFLDAYLKHFTECQRPQLRMISLRRRDVVGCQSRRRCRHRGILIFASLHFDLLLNWLVFCCRASDVAGPLKTAEQKPSSSSAFLLL
jgi:hypothetical protein